MKSSYQFATFLLLFPLVGFAQQNAEVKLSVHLADFQSITVNPSQEEVSLHVLSPEDFYNGTSLDQKNHLEITSTTEYEIKVATSSDLQGENASLSAGNIRLNPALSAGGNPAHAMALNEVVLSTGLQTLIHSGKGEIGRSFDMNYTIQGGEELMNKPEGVYSTTISYIMLPK